jgi:hypothetical protein
MLSPALQGMISGDFAFGDHPRVFLRRFDITEPAPGATPVGEWTTSLATQKASIDPTSGVIIWVNGYKNQYAYKESDKGDHISGNPTTDYGLQHQNGIIEFPFHDNPVMSSARRIHTNESGTEKFHYIWKNGANANKIDPTHYDEITRDASSVYRLNAETYIADVSDLAGIEITQEQGVEILIGNPFMEQLDFVKFAQRNAAVIEPHYRIYTTTPADEEKYIEVLATNLSTPTLTVTNKISGTADTDYRYIAPQQAFFVRLKGSTATPRTINDLTFNIADGYLRSSATPNLGLRSTTASPETDIIRIQASNSKYSSEALIAKRATVSDGYRSSEDVYKLFPQDTDIPVVYTLADRYALAMNFIQGETEVTVPLGIKTEQLGATTLSLTGMSGYAADKIEFIDATANQTIDISDNDAFEYAFNNQTQGTQEGQFYIRILRSTTGTQLSATTGLQVYRSADGINVVSSSTDKIQQITVYDIQGRLLYNAAHINSDLYRVQKSFNDKIVVVKVITEQGTHNLKLIKE